MPKQLDLPMATVRESQGQTLSFAVIEASTERVLQAEIHKYLKQYSPQAYSTSIVEQPERREDGVWTAQLSRYSSPE